MILSCLILSFFSVPLLNIDLNCLINSYESVILISVLSLSVLFGLSQINF